MAASVTLSVEQQDVVDARADVVVLKFAREFYGAADAVAERLLKAGVRAGQMKPAEGSHALVETRGGIAAKRVLWMGVTRLRDFRYDEIRQFAARTLRVLEHEAADTQHLAMTIHGPGYGLDEVEGFCSLLEGCLEAIRGKTMPAALSSITIVERNAARVERLRHALMDYRSGDPTIQRGNGILVIPLAGPEPKPPPLAEKGHVFVAMPFTEEMEDVFYYGVQGPVHRAGLLCERIDFTQFTGDIVEQIKRRIETATVVVADMTGKNANVYLEVGYAWGRGRPTVLIARSLDDLTFDVKGHKCILYQGSIKKLESSLEQALEAIVRNRPDVNSLEMDP